MDRIPSDAMTPGQSVPGNDGKNGYSAFLKAPALLKPRYQIV